MFNPSWSPAEQDVLNVALRRVHHDARPYGGIGSMSAVDVSDLASDNLHDVLDARGLVDEWEGDLFWEAVDAVGLAALAGARRVR